MAKKLSAPQKEIVRIMRDGYGGAFPLIQYSNLSQAYKLTYILRRVNNATFSALLNKGFIEYDKETSLSSRAYRLTELGKTIEL